MAKVVCWLLILGGFLYAWCSGWFEGIGKYFLEGRALAKNEKVIKLENGSYEVIKYKNVFDLLTGK